MKETVSAGGIVLNPSGKILMVQQRGRAWSFPKGHVESGESLLETARREIFEETGASELDLVRELGRYKRPKIGLNCENDTTEMKTLVFFLFRTSEAAAGGADADITEVRWATPEEAASLLTHRLDRDFFLSIKDTLS